jgi:hypothetical protein
MCAEIAPTEKQSKIFEKMFILKYTIKTGVFSRFFLLFCLPLEIGVLFLKSGCVVKGPHILLRVFYFTVKKMSTLDA